MKLVTSPALPPRRYVDNGALGMALFVFTEVMLFAGFISAFVIVRSGVPAAAWPPPDQPRLPVERTAINTVVLLLSGVALFVARRQLKAGSHAGALRWMGGAIALGTAFLVLQGGEWVALLRQGFTLTSSQLGSFFYLIIGAHAFHAVCAIVALSITWLKLRARRITETRLAAVSLFWYFVVLVWPVLYWRLYS